MTAKEIREHVYFCNNVSEFKESILHDFDISDFAELENYYETDSLEYPESYPVIVIPDFIYFTEYNIVSCAFVYPSDFS